MTFCNNLLAAVYTCRTLKTFDTLRNEKHYKGSPEPSKAAEILYQAKMENISDLVGPKKMQYVLREVIYN